MLLTIGIVIAAWLVLMLIGTFIASEISFRVEWRAQFGTSYRAPRHEPEYVAPSTLAKTVKGKINA